MVHNWDATGLQHLRLWFLAFCRTSLWRARGNLHDIFSRERRSWIWCMHRIHFSVMPQFLLPPMVQQAAQLPYNVVSWHTGGEWLILILHIHLAAMWLPCIVAKWAICVLHHCVTVARFYSLYTQQNCKVFYTNCECKITCSLFFCGVFHDPLFSRENISLCTAFYYPQIAWQLWTLLYCDALHSFA